MTYDIDLMKFVDDGCPNTCSCCTGDSMQDKTYWEDRDKAKTYWEEYAKAAREEFRDYPLDRLILIMLEEHPLYCWRSYTSLSHDAFGNTDSLNVDLTLESITRLYNEGKIVRNPHNSDQYGIKERVAKESSYGWDSPIQDEVKTPTHEIKTLTQLDMFQGLTQCLQDIQKIITRTSDLNRQLQLLE